jgi:hypothetical protein
MMLSPKYLSIKNFEKFQHYKRRNPPWLKLYYELLDDDSFITMSTLSRHHYMTLLLVAGRKDNQIPDDPAFLKKVMRLDEEPDLTELKQRGFLIAWCRRRARKSIAPCERHALSETDSESEYSETEKEKRIDMVKSADLTVSPHVYPGQLPWNMEDEFAQFWRLYPRKVHRQRARKHWWYVRQRGATVDEILEGLEAALASGEWTQVKFIPHPASWLNARGWKDEYT